MGIGGFNEAAGCDVWKERSLRRSGRTGSSREGFIVSSDH